MKNGRTLLKHAIELGPTSRRFVCVRKPTWALMWHIEYSSVSGVAAVDGATSVKFVLKPPASPITIECMTTAVVPLVEEMASATLREVADDPPTSHLHPTLA